MRHQKVLIVDDHAAVRLGMRYMLLKHWSGCTVWEAENRSGLFRILESQEVTHLILDLQLNEDNALIFFSELKTKYPDIYILIYTMSPEEVFGKKLLQMGALGCLDKQSDAGEVLFALDLFMRGRRYISKYLQELILLDAIPGPGSPNPFHNLSERELMVAHSLLQGLGIKEIAGQLNLRMPTVSTYKARIFEKIGVRNVLDLKHIAMAHRQN